MMKIVFLVFTPLLTSHTCFIVMFSFFMITNIHVVTNSLTTLVTLRLLIFVHQSNITVVVPNILYFLKMESNLLSHQLLTSEWSINETS